MFSDPDLVPINIDHSLHKGLWSLLRQIVTDAARDWMGTRGYDPEFGARPLRRLIQNELEDVLSDGILSGKFHIASVVRVTVGEDGELLLEEVQEALPEPGA